MDQYQQYGVAQDSELDWNSCINKESDFILLPDGDYDFVVECFERARHNGSDKLPPCNKAIVKIRIDTAQGSVTIPHNLFLHTKTEGMLSSFFSSIGQKKKGEPLQMNWNSVPGAKGRLKLGHKLYNGNEYNEIKKFYSKEEIGQQTATFQPGTF